MNRGKRRAHLAGVAGGRNPSRGEGSRASACCHEEMIWKEGTKHRREESSWVCSSGNGHRK